MKRLIIFLVLITVFQSTYAQFGVKGGMNLSDISTTDLYNSRVGFYVGATYNQGIAKKSDIQYEISFNSIGGNYNKDIFKGGGYINIYSLELPVRYLYKINLSNSTTIILGGGLYFRCGLFGRDKRVFDDEVHTQSSFVNYNRVDLGGTIDLGLSVRKIDILLSYKVGFANTIKNSDSKFITLGVGIGYKFI